MCRFFASQGEKTTHNNNKVPCCRRRKRCERKPYSSFEGDNLMQKSYLIGRNATPRRALAIGFLFQADRLDGQRIVAILGDHLGFRAEGGVVKCPGGLDDLVA